MAKSHAGQSGATQNVTTTTNLSPEQSAAYKMRNDLLNYMLMGLGNMWNARGMGGDVNQQHQNFMNPWLRQTQPTLGQMPPGTPIGASGPSAGNPTSPQPSGPSGPGQSNDPWNLNPTGSAP